MPEGIVTVAENETTPIQAPTPLNDQIAAGVRVLVISLGMMTTLSGLLSRRDLAGFIVYVQSNEFLTAVGMIATVGAFTWSQWKTRHRAKQLNVVAKDPRVPDDVIVASGAAK